MESTYFRKGFGLKAEIEGRLTADYHSTVVEAMRANQYRLTAGPLTFRLAREFGFCYGVDRAVDYAYETRAKFPDRRLHLVGEIIHNPHVNRKLKDMGIRFLERGESGEFDFSPIAPSDAVILPAFGVTISDFERLKAIGCVLVDTTCGSVLNVWKRVESYARDGFTAVIHGKHYHEETKATASQVMRYPGGRYLVVLNMAEARLVCDFIEGQGDGATLEDRFRRSVSPGFLFERDLLRVGIANQTTMLSGESLAIAEVPPQHGPPLRRCGGAGSLPVVRYDLLRHPGAAGRRPGTAGGAARRDGGGGRLQLQQHLPSGGAGALPRHPGVPHRGCGRHRPRGGGDPPSADRHEAGGAGGRVAGRRAPHRHHGRRVDAEQQGRRDHRPDLRHGGRGAGAGRAGGQAGRRAVTSGKGVGPVSARPTFIDLSHTITHGMTTYPGLPGPVICDFLSREASRGKYAPGVEFQIGRIDMVANTGTYVDSPFHRYADGTDLAGLGLESLADLEVALVDARVSARSVPGNLPAPGSKAGPCWCAPAGTRTGAPSGISQAIHSHRRRRAPLADEGAALVGIDSLNIDDTADLARGSTPPARRGLRSSSTSAGCTSFPTGSRFFAVPAKVAGVRDVAGAGVRPATT
jgi:(E)-4-hydroxy-3-methyl-but-2-enyl pyrophosphate reductase